MLQFKKLEDKVSVHSLHSEFKTLKAKDLHELRTTELINAVINTPHSLPVCFQNYITPLSNLHQHRTRQKQNLHLASVNNAYGARKLSYHGAKMWNALPENLKSLPSRKQFRVKYMEWKLSKYT